MFPELKYILVHSVIHAIATEIAGNNPSAYPLRRQLHLNFLDSSMNVISHIAGTLKPEVGRNSRR